MNEVLGQVIAVGGGLVFVAAAVGLYRLPDPYMRTSSVATAAGLGVALVVLGAAIVAPGPASLVTAAIAIVLQLATSGVAGIAIGRAAVLSGHRFSDDTDTGPLAGTLDGHDDGDGGSATD